MKRRRCSFSLYLYCYLGLGCFFCLMAAPAGGETYNFYLKPYAFIDTPVPLLKDLVYDLAGSPAALPETEAQPGLDYPGSSLLYTGLDKLPVTRLSLVPVRLIRQALDGYQAAAFTLTGQRIALIPTAQYPRSLHIFYKELLLFLATLDTSQDGRLELEITALPPLLAAPGNAGETAGSGNTAGGRAGAAADVVHAVGFEVIQAAREQDYLAGTAEILCIFNNSLTEPAGTKTAGIKARADTQAKPRQSLRCTIYQYIPVVALKQAGKKGELIGGEQLAVTEISADRYDSSLVKAGNALLQGPFVLTRDLPQGSLLKIKELEARPGVKAGEEIKLAFSKGTIVLRLPGKACSTAAIGEEVVVFPLATQKKFKGTVTATREVKIDID